MKRTDASYMDTAFEFGITNYSTIATWNSVFLEEGIAALNRPKRRPPMSNKTNKKENKSIKDEKKTRKK